MRRRVPGFAARFEAKGTRGSGLAIRIAVAYTLLAAVAIALGLALRDGPPWVHPSPWMPLPAGSALVLSASLGVGFASVVVLLTRICVARFGWARRLHAELRPVARDLSLRDVLLVAGLSSLGEELLFRGLLTPTVGVAVSALLFGAAHQIRGQSRWVWTAWATAVGLALGAIFALTGSLVGPLLAHAIINAVNLTYLRDYEPGPA
jgi:membrane protease YdiL (CAAX protease family)